jgi:hypothetical protein
MTPRCSSKPKSELFASQQDARFLSMLLTNYRVENSGNFPKSLNVLLTDPLFELDINKITELENKWIYNYPLPDEVNDPQFVVFEKKTANILVRVKIRDL